MSYQWKNILVSPETTIREALTIIDREALKLALVVDLEKKLVGTVSDGDIRRALIRSVSLESEIVSIVNREPVVVNETMSRQEILELMSEKQIFAIPRLTNGVVVGLETLISSKDVILKENPVFLMAGGFGTRLRPLTDNCPKPLLKVGNRPILETVLRSFIKAGFHNFYISTHYLPEMIREHFSDGSKWGVNISYVHEDKPLGTGGALGLLPKNRPDLPIIVMNGDVLTKINFDDLLHYHNIQKANATICVREYEYQVPFGVIQNDDSRITHMVEKPIEKFHVNAGIYVISNDIAKSVGRNESVDMPTLLQRYLNNKVMMFSFQEYWLDIGRMDDYTRAQQDYKTLGIG